MTHVHLLSESGHIYKDQPEDVQLYIASHSHPGQEKAHDIEQIL